MRALVLTCDRYSMLLAHMVSAYETLWPKHPFVFRIPYQRFPGRLVQQYGHKIDPIPSAPDIYSTIRTLIDDLPDNEWVYWCIDDRYPVAIDVTAAEDIYEWIPEAGRQGASAIMFSRPLKLHMKPFVMAKSMAIVDSAGRRYLRRADYSEIWVHQFLQVRVLRELLRGFPTSVFAAKEMDYFKDAMDLPAHHQLYVIERSVAVFGESTTRGKLTRNCVESFRSLGWSLPLGFEVANRTTIIGHETFGAGAKTLPAKVMWRYVRSAVGRAARALKLKR